MVYSHENEEEVYNDGDNPEEEEEEEMDIAGLLEEQTAIDGDEQIDGESD